LGGRRSPRGEREICTIFFNITDWDVKEGIEIGGNIKGKERPNPKKNVRLKKVHGKGGVKKLS